MADYGYEKLWSLIGWSWALGSITNVQESVAKAPHVQAEVTRIKNPEIGRLPKRRFKYKQERDALEKLLKDDQNLSATKAEAALRQQNISPVRDSLEGKELDKARHAFEARISSVRKKISGKPACLSRNK
jgi:hypothetical protein